MLFRWFFILVPAVLAPGLRAQSAILTCSPTAVPTTVRSEGVAERTGDVLLSCSGGQPSAQVTGNIIVSLNVQVTNKILSDGSTDVTLSVDNGAGVTTFNARPFSGNAVAFNGVAFTVSPQGRADLRIVNLRGNASQLGFTANSTITSSVSFTGAGLSVPSSTFVVAYPQRGLFALSNGTLVCDQYGSPLPDVINYATLLGTSAFESVRFTEGFASAFAPLSDASNLRADSGIRFIARYTGFTAGARLFVPDAIAGNDATTPTSAGDFGLGASGGQYTPGQGQLLLIRVTGADSNGAGGSLVMPVPNAPATFNSASEIALTGGSGYAVYEVVDANPFVRESAQYPTFLGLAPNSGASAVQTGFAINLAPVTTVFTQSASAPAPRFISTPPPSDCTVQSDCNAGYFPDIQIDTSPISVTVPAGSTATRYVPIRNNGSGTLRWSATVAYGSGSNWLILSPTQAVNNSTLRIDAVASNLQPGTYTATVSIDAGPTIGVRTIPVTLIVSTPVPPSPSITTISNAASADQTELVAGSLATVWGSHFGGRNLQVTFDGTPGSVLFSNDQQINVQVPMALAGKQTASVLVAVDGISSVAKSVNLSASAPSIFPGAVLNQDSRVNSETTTARTGSVVQIFATGLPAAGVITARIHDRSVPVPLYGGAAPGLPGVQQVNLMIPGDLPTMQTYVFVCGGATADQQVCSAPEKLWITR